MFDFIARLFKSKAKPQTVLFRSNGTAMRAEHENLVLFDLQFPASAVPLGQSPQTMMEGIVLGAGIPVSRISILFAKVEPEAEIHGSVEVGVHHNDIGLLVSAMVRTTDNVGITITTVRPSPLLFS